MVTNILQEGYSWLGFEIDEVGKKSIEIFSTYSDKAAEKADLEGKRERLIARWTGQTKFEDISNP